jgi:iron complex outermembrane recepter protein
MFRTTLEKRRTRLLCGTAMAVAGFALCAPSIAQTSQGAIESVVVTGSRIPVSSAFDAPTPVSIIGQEDIKMSGTLNVENILNQSPQFTGATNGSPSSNTQQANGNSGAAYANLRNLNSGSNTPRTLVLVNGRRWTINGTSLATDLNTIPTALIQRTEIVTGGSSAVYGSDAIAGVINFVMKQDFTGAEVDSQVNFDSYTGTPEYSFDVTVGSNFDHDRGNVAVSMDYLNRGGIRQSQVSYAKYPLNESCVTTASWMRDGPGTANGASAANCAASGGRMGFTQGGSTSSPAGQFNSIFTGTDATLASLKAAAGIGTGSFTFDGTTARPVNNPTDLYNLTSQNYMQIPQERWMINSFAHYDIAPWITAYAEMHFSNNTVSVQLTPSNLGGQSFLVNTNNPYLSPAMDAVLVRLDQLETGTTSIVEGSKTYTTTPGDGLAILQMNRRFVELGNRTDDDNRVAWRFAGGFRGDIGSLSDSFMKDLSYDIYYDYARTIDTNWLSGVGARSAIQDAILSQNGQAPVCDIFGPNMSAACVKKVGITDQYTTKAEQAGAVGSLSGTAFDAPAGPVQFNLGLEWRFDSAQYIPDQYLATGEPTGFNYSYPTKGNTSVKEVFGELRVPVIKDVTLIKSLTVNGAFRNSSYSLSGVGSVWTYSAGADWKVVDDIAFRGQFQHAIRAPNVGELYGGSALNFQSNTIDPCGGQYTGAHTAALQALCVATGVPAGNVWTNVVQDASKLVGYTSGGNPNLAQEASDTITLGTVLTPRFVPGLQASVDFYSIDIKGAIGVFGGSANAVLNNCYLSGNTSAANQNCAVINRDSSGVITAPYYINLGNVNAAFLKTQGVDVGAAYMFDPGFALITGDSTITVTSNWTIATEFKSVGTTGIATSCLGQFGGTCLEPSPNWKGVSNVNWHDGPLTLNLRWRFIGSTTDDRHKLQGIPLAAMTNPVIPIYNYFDLSGSYDINENLTATAGVNNLFELEPPTPAKTSYGNTWPATYDAFGRTIFINLTAKTN